MQALLGQKIDQSQRFLQDGTRVPVTVVAVADNPVVAIKTEEKNGYSAVQIGYGTAKKPTKSLIGIAKKANLSSTPRFFREVKIANDALPTIGDFIKVTDVFKPGDIIQVTGISKGKGWAGVVKRHHFRGGPRTHGQSDRERAPGSIGQTTTPGRVYKGKRMAGRMGAERVSVKNLTVVDVTESTLLVTGLIPGPVNNIVLITKTGEKKKFVPLYTEPQEVEEAAESVSKQAQSVSTEEAVTEEKVSQEATASESPAEEPISDNAGQTVSTEAVAESEVTAADAQPEGADQPANEKQEEETTAVSTEDSAEPSTDTKDENNKEEENAK